MSATSSGSQDWDHSGSSQVLAGTGGFLGGALYGGSRIPGGSSGPPHIPPACSKGREIASRQRGVAGCQRPSGDGLGELGHTSLWEVQRWRLRDLRRRGSGTPESGGAGAQILRFWRNEGWGGEGSRAQDGERGQRGHLCRGAKKGKREKKEVKEEENTGSWEGAEEECGEGPTSPGGRTRRTARGSQVHRAREG